MQETRAKSGARKAKARASNDQPAAEVEESLIGTPAAPDPPQISALAIIALVMASLGILLIPGLIGLVTGIVALWQIEESRGRLSCWRSAGSSCSFSPRSAASSEACSTASVTSSGVSFKIKRLPVRSVARRLKQTGHLQREKRYFFLMPGEAPAFLGAGPN